MIANLIMVVLVLAICAVGRRAYLDAKEADRREALRGKFDPWGDER